MKLPMTVTALTSCFFAAATVSAASSLRQGAPSIGLRGNVQSAELPNDVPTAEVKEGEKHHAEGKGEAELPDAVPTAEVKEGEEHHAEGESEEHHDEAHWEEHDEEHSEEDEEIGHEHWRYEADENEGNGANGAHYAAHIGDVNTLLHIVETGRKEMLHETDVNGWLPIHEGVRSGNVEIMKILLAEGVDVNARTSWGEGRSALSLAEEIHEEGHPIFEYLLSVGAESLGPVPEL